MRYIEAQNREADRMNLIIHSKTNLKVSGEEGEERRSGGEKGRKSKWGRRRDCLSFKNDNVIVSNCNIVIFF